MEDFLNSILDNLEQGFVILDIDGIILFVNKVAAEWGEAFLGKRLQINNYLADYLLPFTNQMGEIVKEIKQSGVSQKTFLELANSESKISTFELTILPVTNGKDQLTNLQLYIRDLTEQRIFESRIATLAANTTHLIENANAVIIGTDARGYITDWNKHCTLLTAYTKDEAYAQKFTYLLLDQKEIPILEELIARVLNQEPYQNFEISIRTKEKKARNLLLNCTVSKTATGKVVGLIFVGQDITELTEYRKSLEKKVEEKTKELQLALAKEKEAVEMKSRLVSIASHEFRIPLSSIQFELDTLKNNEIDAGILRKRLVRVENQVHHMNRLLDDVLTYGKNEKGKIQRVPSDISLVDFLNQITQQVAYGNQKTHTIETEYNKLPEFIRTDEKLLRGILINLLTNAIKFSPGKERVFLTVTGDAPNVKIIVRDEGLGIPIEEVDKIFEPFLRGKSGEGIAGTGLGLSIVKKSVELLEGTIDLESEENKGATFTVTIPATL